MSKKNKKTDKKETTEKSTSTKKSWEWSKWFTVIVAIIFGAYSIWSGVEYFILCREAIELGSEMPECSLPVACVTTVMSSLWSYCAYQGILKTSLNKNKLTIDENGVVKKIMDFAEESFENIKK